MGLKKILEKISGIFSFKTIRSKLLTAFILTTIPVILLGTVSYNISKNAIQNMAETNTMVEMRQARNYLELMLSNIDSISVQFISNQDLQSYMATDKSDIMRNYELLNDISRL